MNLKGFFVIFFFLFPIYINVLNRDRLREYTATYPHIAIAILNDFNVDKLLWLTVYDKRDWLLTILPPSPYR
jgi:hypothetical protein